MTDFGTYCGTRLATALTCCALAFSAPFAIGGEGLIEDRVWTTALASGSSLPLESFVSHFPESRFVTEARERIAALRDTRTVSLRQVPASGVFYVQ